MNVLVSVLSWVVAACAAPSAWAEPAPKPLHPNLTPSAFAGLVKASGWRLMASPYTIHYSPDVQHRRVWMVGVEHERSDGFLLGATYFSNSFGQPSGFLYAGQRLYDFSAYPQLFAQWTAGVMYGYRGEFKDKVPFNHGGFSPGVVLSLGWQFTPRYSVQANVLGNSALMFQFAVELP